MTKQEAKEWLNLISGTFNEVDKRSEALNTAIKALEKQIAKKPSEVNEKQDGLFYVLSFMCPSCNEPVIGQPYKPNHCKHCGQKLDWE